MTVGELARALNLVREFVYTDAGELGVICLRLPDDNGKYSSKFELNAVVRSASHGAHDSLCSDPVISPNRQ
jgi:hypothetical protein